MANKHRATGEYQGVPFRVTEYWQFEVIETEKRYASYEEMKSAIERFLAAKKVVKRDKLDIPAITGKGLRVAVTGIHSGNGHPTAKPKIDSHTTLYPDVKWIASAVAEERELRKRAAHIDQVLEQFELNSSSRLRSFSTDKLAEWTQEFCNRAAAALKAANATHLEKELAEKPYRETRY